MHPPLRTGDVKKLDICTPPIGLAYIGAYLRQHGHRVRIIDAEVEKLGIKQIAERVKDACLVGITTTAPIYSSALELANTIKRLNSKTKVVFGGPQATFLDTESLERSAADAVVRGEGEFTMQEIASSLESDPSRSMEGIAGVTYKEAGMIVKNPDRELIANLDDIPFPARDLLPMERYTPPESTGVVSSRGCPFRCIFCASSKLYNKKFRSRSAQNVFEEVTQLVAKGYKNVTMLDDNFILNKERAFAFADLVEEHNVKFEFSCTGRVDSIDEDLLHRLHDVGCTGLFFGVESASDETLTLIKKGFTTDQVIDAFSTLKHHDIPTTASFMLGLPGDDARKVANTINLAKHISPDFAMFSVTTPYPGTELYDNIDHYDLEITAPNWDRFTLTRPVVRTSALSTRELQRWFLKAYFSFYVRLSYLRQAYSKGQLGFVLSPVKNAITTAVRGTFAGRS